MGKWRNCAAREIDNKLNNAQCITIAKYNAGNKLKKKMNLNENITIGFQESAKKYSTILLESRKLIKI